MENQTKIFDDNGNELFQIDIFNLCKAEHIQAVREEMVDFWKVLRPDVTFKPTDFMTDKLSFNGADPATHYFCATQAFTHEMQARINYLTNSFDWACNEIHDLDSDYLNHGFCIITCTKAEFLADSGLQVVN